MKLNYRVNNSNSMNGDLPKIIRAAYAHDHEYVGKLLDDGIDVNTVDPRDNLSLLHIGCMTGDDKLVDIVLERERVHGDVDFEIKSSYRPRQAWQLAVNINRFDISGRVDRAGLAKRKAQNSINPASSPNPN